ncbi:unnamed protein product [Linum tenue]|uniref:Uncharacterized protein n=1 Tax=Linum tenue TaxID=586396 RepID=A0AAV0MAK7_9ROSI|nr:unnamed protein product [Linum tenue]
MNLGGGVLSRAPS